MAFNSFIFVFKTLHWNIIYLDDWVFLSPSYILCLTSVQFSCSVVSDSLQPHESQHARPPCPSPTPRAYSNSCPSSRWCHPAISSLLILIPTFPWTRGVPVFFTLWFTSTMCGIQTNKQLPPRGVGAGMGGLGRGSVNFFFHFLFISIYFLKNIYFIWRLITIL